MVRMADEPGTGEKRRCRLIAQPPYQPIPASDVRETQVTTFCLRIAGLVQGVGFRPYVYRTAQHLQLKGCVSNGAAGVRIVFNATPAQARQFADTLLAHAPPHAIIEQVTLTNTHFQDFSDFQIAESAHTGIPRLILPPDIAPCKTCLAEMSHPQNRRYRYPFISCTDCGPRYSILRRLPYDRPHTDMADFGMCANCRTEYNEPQNHRFYAQTNACAACGPALSWYFSKGDGQVALQIAGDNEACLQAARSAFQEGKIIAVKGVGGYLLMCDAHNQAAVQRLRDRKQRPHKPFALLCADLAMAERYAQISLQEAEALTGSTAPIVLLERKTATFPCEAVAPQLNRLGIMLPAAPLLHLLANDFGQALVATSGNISGSPILHTEAAAFNELAPIADYFLTNNRPITAPQDDSVWLFTPSHKRRIILRRGRGMILSMPPLSKTKAVAFGASLKSNFAVQTNDRLYVSPYAGNLESLETQQHFTQTYQRWLQWFDDMDAQQVPVILADKHPGYFSTQLAETFTKKDAAYRIQHHFAHFAAVLAENNLQNRADDVIGVVWDGAGWGDDRQIRGAEFFCGSQWLSIAPMPLILGDKLMREPRLSALVFFADAALAGEPANRIQRAFSNKEWQLYHQLIAATTLSISSMGRIFDAVAFLLGAPPQQSYEGQAAIWLEQQARAATTDFAGIQPYPIALTEEKQLSLAPMKAALAADIASGQTAAFIALRFHHTLVAMVEQMAQHFGQSGIAFSGGVFQNSLLVDLLITHLSDRYTLYFHHLLPPNDENIAYGQIAAHHLSSINLNQSVYVSRYSG